MPRKKAEKVVEEQEEFDVDEPSEIEELENNATDDDWTPADEEKKTPGRPQRAARNRKPVKVTDGKTTSDEEEEEELEDEEPEESRGVKRKRGNVAVRGGGRGRGRGRGGGAPAPASVKRARTDENGKGRGKKKSLSQDTADPEADEAEDVDDEEGIDEEEDSVSDEEDTDDDSEVEDAEIPPQFKSGRFVLLKADFDNKEENYPIWKIDGKSLLQKFDKFIHNDDELYKGTTIYAGWSKAIIHTYYPINVEVKTLENGESTIKFDPSQITEEMKNAVYVSTTKDVKKSSSDKEEEEEEEDEDEEAAGEPKEEEEAEAEAEE